MRPTTAFLLCILLVSSCARPEPAPSSSATLPPVDGEAMKAHIQKLASDEMEGRAPGGKGEELATGYIADFFKSIGLKTQFQQVPLVGITSAASPLKLAGKGGARSLKFGDEFMAWSKQQKDSIPVNGDLVFCGYGVVAPEY